MNKTMQRMLSVLLAALLTLGFALSASAKRLLTRSILYTGVTRARDILILVGDENVAKAMIANSKRSNRFTFLKLRLKKASLN